MRFLIYHSLESAPNACQSVFRAVNGYVPGKIREVACWAHARRKFFDAQVSYGAEAGHILELIGGLYAIERRAKAMGVSRERLLAWRQRYARRRLTRLRAELDRLSLIVLPKSALGKAITHVRRGRGAMWAYRQPGLT